MIGILAVSRPTFMFALLGAPYYRRHAVRCMLVVACMALTAAVHIGVNLGNASLEGVFADTLDRIAGRAEIQISGAGGVPEDLLEKIRELDCVSEAAATFLRSVPVQLPGESAVAVLGVDLLEDDRFRDYAVDSANGNTGGFDDALILLAQPDSVLVTHELAQRRGLSKGSALPVWTGRENRSLIVRGLLENTELTGAYGGNLAVMDLYAAQHVFSQRGLFDRIDVRAQEGWSVEACAATLDGAFERQFTVTPTARAGGSTRAFTAMYAAVVDASTLLALLAALMLIHHASAVGVAQREKEIAILISLGADVGRIRRFVLAEAAIAGMLAGTLGLAVGYVAARPFATALQGVLRSALGFVLEPGDSELDPVWAAGAVLVTAMVSVAGAWSAAGVAASVPPIQLAGGRRYSERGDRGQRGAFAHAAFLAGAAVALQRLWTSSAALYICLPLALLALWRLARALERPLFAFTSAVFAALWPLAGPLAVHSLVRERRRVRGPLLAIAFSVALLVTISGVTTSYANRFLAWASDRIRMDYVIHSAGSLSEHGAFLPPETYERLLAADGIAQVARLRRMTGRAAGRPARLFAVDLAVLRQVAGLSAPSGPYSATVARNFASRAGLEAGDVFVIETPSGPLELRADHVVEDYISELGAVYFDWGVYERFFQTEAIEMLGVVLDSSTERASAREWISELLPAGAPILIVDPSQVSAHIRAMTDRWRQANSLQALAVIPVAVLAAGSFLAISLAGKRRQLAILEAVGATPAEIRRVVWAEAAALGLAGTVLGLGCGALLQLFVLDSIEQTLLGFHLPFELGWRLILGLVVAGPAGAIAAAWIPTRSLGRMPLARQLADQ